MESATGSSTKSLVQISNEFGPFTPQELEKVVDWLTSKNLKFQIGKDQQTEDSFRSNDGSNVLNRTEWRTNVYLAQIFMVQVLNMNANQILQLNQLLVPAEKIPQKFLNHSIDDSAKRAKLQQVKKMTWSWIALIFLGGPVIFSIIKILFKGE